MFVYLFFFLLLFIVNRRYKSPVLNFVLLFYTMASICAIITHYWLNPRAYSTPLSIIFHIFCLYAFIMPILAYGKNERKRSFILMDDKRFKLLSWSLIVLQIYSIIFFSGTVYSFIRNGDFYAIRSNLLVNADINAGRSLFRTVAGVASYYYCFNILLFFYSIAFRSDKKWFLILLFGSSLSRVFHSMTYVGRDGILFWILACAFSFFTFKPYLDKNRINFIKRISVSFGAIAVLFIMLISLSRFGASDKGTLLSLIDYYGQPLNNFGRLFDKVNDYNGTRSIFPLLYGQRGATGGEAMDNAEIFYSRYGFYSNAFFTFVGNMYRAWGTYVTVVISFFYMVFMSMRMNRVKTSMRTLIILMFCSQMVLHNYFYWAYGIQVANLFIFTLPLFLIYCGTKEQMHK